MARKKAPEITFQDHIAAYLVREHRYGVLEQPEITDTEHAIADAYRSKTGLLTSHEIKSLRISHGLSQQQLADLINVGVASIKRWETGLIQSKSMDHILRMQLQCRLDSDNYTHMRMN